MVDTSQTKGSQYTTSESGRMTWVYLTVNVWMGNSSRQLLKYLDSSSPDIRITPLGRETNSLTWRFWVGREGFHYTDQNSDLKPDFHTLTYLHPSRHWSLPYVESRRPPCSGWECWAGSGWLRGWRSRLPLPGDVSSTQSGSTSCSLARSLGWESTLIIA